VGAGVSGGVLRRLLLRWLSPPEPAPVAAPPVVAPPDPALLARVDHLEAERTRLNAEIERLTDRLAAVEGARGAPRVVLRRPTCRVDGCGSPQRARGFCTRHYQAWRRGALYGFVLPDGRVEFEDGAAYRVDRLLAGMPAAHDGGALKVGQREARGRRVAPRIKAG
jgi:hypothetical protein